MKHIESMAFRNLKQILDMVYACTRCGYCREKYSSEMTHTPAFRVCPVREHAGGFEHHCARWRILIAQGILEGRVDLSQELTDLIYADPDCGLCTYVCNTLPLIDPPKVWRALRRDLLDAGFGPPEPVKRIDEHVQGRHNTFGARVERAKWAEGLNLPQQGDILYFAGCYASYVQTEIARATVAILRKGGCDPAYMENREWCCGVTQFHDGSVDIAEEMARHNIEQIKASGAKTVVTGCAECCKSLKLEYPALTGALPFEVLHSSEIMARMLGDGKISLLNEPTEKILTYHDPCHLGRYCGVYEPPRTVLQGFPGVSLVEMQRHHAYAWCCGHGADMVNTINPKLALDIATDRMAEARDAGAEALITACPRCARSLQKADQEMKVYDLTVAVAGSMGLEI